MRIEEKSIVEISANEMMFIVGGSQESYQSGYEAGAYVRKVLDGVGVLSALRALLFL